MEKKKTIRRTLAMTGASLLLAGAVVAVPVAASAATITNSQIYYSYFLCNVGRQGMSVSGYVVSDQCYPIGEAGWFFTYLVK